MIRFLTIIMWYFNKAKDPFLDKTDIVGCLAATMMLYSEADKLYYIGSSAPREENHLTFCNGHNGGEINTNTLQPMSVQLVLKENGLDTQPSIVKYKMCITNIHVLTIEVHIVGGKNCGSLTHCMTVSNRKVKLYPFHMTFIPQTLSFRQNLVCFMDFFGHTTPRKEFSKIRTTI